VPLLISVVSYAGLALVLAGSCSLVRPLRVLHIRQRSAALVVLAVGLACASIGAWWPWPVHRGGGDTALDAVIPEFQFYERHEIRVHADADAVYRAIRGVTANEIRSFRTLTWIRSPRLPWHERRESILTPDWQTPILDVATRSGFLWLADEPRELVVGTVVCCRATRPADADAFRRLVRPGVAKAVMNFRIEPQGDRDTRLTTETRVVATNVGARRRFGAYWALIYPGSSLIRYGWLNAIRRRAEGERR
jgi:hypothetical protein